MKKIEDTNYLAFVATQAALQAGEVLRQGFGKEQVITNKPGRQNIVTQYDHDSEKVIVDLIKSRFPNHTILAEEGGLSETIKSDNVLWLIDPLDGTSNFAHHIPFFGISIAAFHKGQGLFGVIFQPITNELFIAVKGEGAYLNGKRLEIKGPAKLEEAMIHVGFPSESTQHPTMTIQALDKLNKTGATTRNMGSAAIGLAYMAAGKIDGFWMNNLHPWDWAAGKVIVEEAGGKFTFYSRPEEIYSHPSNILATNQQLHATLASYIK